MEKSKYLLTYFFNHFWNVGRGCLGSLRTSYITCLTCTAPMAGGPMGGGDSLSFLHLFNDLWWFAPRSTFVSALTRGTVT